MSKRCITIFIASLALFCSSLFAQVQVPISKPTKNDIKITLLSIGSGSSRFSYERAFSPLLSAELTGGVIGWGFDCVNHTNSKGWLMKAAVKWNLIPQPKANTWLAGFYVKPEFIFADYDYPDKDLVITSDVEIPHTTQWALLAECGYQFVYSWFLLDVYFGVGYSNGTGNANNYFHGFLMLPKDSNLAWTSGFRIGVNF